MNSRPLQNAPFRPISASDSKFNPRNTQCIPVVKILERLDLEQTILFMDGHYVTSKDQGGLCPQPKSERVAMENKGKSKRQNTIRTFTTADPFG